MQHCLKLGQNVDFYKTTHMPYYHCGKTRNVVFVLEFEKRIVLKNSTFFIF